MVELEAAQGKLRELVNMIKEAGDSL